MGGRGRSGRVATKKHEKARKEEGVREGRRRGGEVGRKREKVNHQGTKTPRKNDDGVLVFE